MKSKFIKSGSRVTISKEGHVEFLDTLPAAVYLLKFSPMTGFFLESIESFKMPEKIYGSVVEDSKRVLKTYMSNDSSMGVHFNGVKGSGKSLTSKQICIEGARQGIATIVISEPYTGTDFEDFIQSITCKAILFFDEFEKVYDADSQKAVLSLFDGNFETDKMFLLTTNNSHHVSDFLKNRPGRIRYAMDYECLEASVVEEILTDRLEDQSKKSDVIRYTQLYNFITYDMLIALIDEMNMYNETCKESLRMLNIKPDFYGVNRYNLLVSKSPDDKYAKTSSSHDITNFDSFETLFEYSDLHEALEIPTPKSNDEDDEERHYDYLSSSDIHSINTQNQPVFLREVPTIGELYFKFEKDAPTQTMRDLAF